MGKVATTELAGSIVRRVREERGMSRAALAAATGIGMRTLYALETGESENFGLGNYLKVLDALGLSLSVDVEKPLSARESRPDGAGAPVLPWDDLPEIWKLDSKEPSDDRGSR